MCINPDDIEADTLSLAKKRFFQVAEFSTTSMAYEILIKTKVPKINGNCMPLIHVYGYAGNTIIEFNVFVYWSSNKFSYVKATNTGMWQPNLKAFTYTENTTEYIGIALQGSGGYYLHIVVDFLDMWVNTRNYNEGWTIEANTSSTGTIIPPDNLTEIPWQALRTSITGNATTATTATTAATLNSTLPITKGGTGATTAANARTALEAGYTIRRTITTTGAGWYRIAATTVNVGRNYTDVCIDVSLAGKNSQIGLVAVITMGHSGIDHTAIQLSQEAFAEQYSGGITKARIVYPNSSYANKYAYLEIYQAYDVAAIYFIEFQNCRGWATFYDEPIAGEIPDGYSARELTFVHNAIVADKFVGDLTGTSTNSEQLAGVNADQYALKDYANQTFLPLAGGTLTGSLTANSFRGIVNPPRNKGSYFLNEPNTSAAAYIPELMADRLQFFPPANCLLETSSDGTSWVTRSTPNAQKQQLLCCHPSYTAEIDWTAGTQLRITFTADSYVFLSLLYLYLRTSGKIDVVIEQFRNASQDWVEVARQEQVTGQPIHVVLWHTVIRFQNSTNDMHSGKVRVTLIHTGTDTPILDQLRWKGGYPTANPYIYDWDPSRNVMFPAEVRASNFNGSWNNKAVASSFDENSTTTVPTCKQIADYVKSLIGG